MSGGERQRIKLAKYINQKGNTVIVIEHNLDIMKQADYIIDIGAHGSNNGGEIIFTGTPKEMIETANTIMAEYLRNSVK